MAFGRIKRAIVFIGVNKIFIGLKQSSCKAKNQLLRWYGYKIGNRTRVVGPVDISGMLHVGEDVFIGKKFSIHGNGCVFIENNCDIAPEVTFLTGTHIVGTVERRAGKGKTLDTRVGQGTWVGAKTTILPGIDIGKGCVIAAGSLVNKNVDDNTMVAGVPAKVIKVLEPLNMGESNEVETVAN